MVYNSTFVTMKILSINIIGFGKKEKKEWVKELCQQEKPCVLVVQKTKKKTIDRSWIEWIWGNENFGFVQREASGRSGGILTVWDTSVFMVNEVVGNDRLVAIKG